MGVSKYGNQTHIKQKHTFGKSSHTDDVCPDSHCWIHQRHHIQNGPVAVQSSDSESMSVISWQCILLWISCFLWCFTVTLKKLIRDPSYTKWNIHSRTSLVYTMKMMGIYIKWESGTQKKCSGLLGTPTLYASSVLRISWNYQSILTCPNSRQLNKEISDSTHWKHRAQVLSRECRGPGCTFSYLETFSYLGDF